MQHLLHMSSIQGSSWPSGWMINESLCFFVCLDSYQDLSRPVFGTHVKHSLKARRSCSKSYRWQSTCWLPGVSIGNGLLLHDVLTVLFTTTNQLSAETPVSMPRFHAPWELERFNSSGKQAGCLQPGTFREMGLLLCPAHTTWKTEATERIPKIVPP